MLFPQTIGTESDAPIERRSHTYFTILSILQILPFSRNFYYLAIIYFIYLNYDSNSHSARQAESERENVSSAKLPFPCYSKHLHNPFVGRRLVREEVSTCLLCYSEEGQQCKLDPLQITRLKKKYISLSFSFVYWFLNFFLPLPVSLRIITPKTDHNKLL